MSTDDTLALAFNTLAHPRRLRLFRLLVTRPEAGRSFSTLVAASGYRKAALAHHLEIMERGGLVRRQRIGNAMTFQLTPASLTSAMAEAERQVFRATPTAPRAA